MLWKQAIVKWQIEESPLENAQGHSLYENFTVKFPPGILDGVNVIINKDDTINDGNYSYLSNCD